MTLTLPASKTDPYHKGVNIHLASSSSPLCPVAALVQLFKTYPCSPFQQLFTRPHSQAFSQQSALLRILELFLQAGTPTAGFSGNSIRKDAAVTAAANVISILKYLAP